MKIIQVVIVEIQKAAFIEPLVVLLILFVNAIERGWEENNAEKALESLKEIQSETAMAKRDGSSVPNLPARDLVPGDILELRVGDKVPADMRILQLKSSTVGIEQRSFTGESEAVNKTRHGVDGDTDTQDKECLLFAGSTVVNGRCVCLVTRTGMNMEIGKVHSQIQEASQSEEDSPLKRKLNEFGEALTAIIGVICALVWLTKMKRFFSWEYVNGWPANLKSPFEKCSRYFEIAVALAVAAIPEGLPAVVTTCLALGTRKMAPKNALLRKLPSVETLECTTVICSDESGTLTKNQKKSVAKLMGRRTLKVEGTTYDPSDGGFQAWCNDEMDANLQMIAKSAALCNDAGIVNTGDQFSANGMPMEAALKDHPWPLVHEVIEDCRVSDTGVMIVIGDNKHKSEAISRDNGISIPKKDITTMNLTGKDFIDYPYLKRLNVLQQSGALPSSRAEPKNSQEKVPLLKAVGEAISMTSNRVKVAPILKMVKGIMVVYFLLFAGAVHSVVGFTPVDNYLIDCGSTTNTTVDGRVFVGDNSGSQFSISTGDNILGSTTSSPAGSVSGTSLYRTARIFTSVSSYTFPIKSQGRQWIRLYFFPFSYQKYDLTTASFLVQTPDNVLINFQSPIPSAAIVKEFSVIVNSSSLVLSFTPLNNTIAFVNAIEVVNVPAALISDSVMVLPSSLSTTQTMSKEALETIFRVNMGGPLVTPLNDTLQRTWVNDENFLLLKSAALSISRSQVLTYRDGGATPDTAPDVVYRTAQMMSPLSGTSSKLFNVTWMFPLDSGSIYLVRMHFCDIASKAQGELLFNAYIGGFVAAKDLDLFQKTQALASPYYLDFVVRATGNLSVSIGPSSVTGIAQNATLNGLEIMKFGLPSANRSTKKKIGIIVGSVLGGILAIILCIVVACMLRRKSDQGDTHSKTWIPLLTTTNAAGHTHTMGSSGTTTLSSGNHTIVGFRFNFAELQEATKNFDEECVVGVGGFGKVYKGKLQDGTELAVKRANPGSQQGLKEFLTEIDMLSKFRHRHLVSLMGFCDEHSEMILVYEYMANGTLKSHLYGSDLPNLSWKQRLEICIGAARGLHYLHTGSAQGIIHRDVKSANILLDENMMAKVSDFGLSKTGPDLDQTHVSTAVKGSFGYLDPEYFRRQQLTEKSDVYSFGVVLLEVLCARPVIDPTLPREKVNIADWAMKWQRRGQLAQVIDPRLAGTIKAASLRKFGETIQKCLAEYGSDRPSMGDVLWNLEYALQLQETSVHADPDDNSANRIIDTPVQISQSDIYASQMANKDGTSSGDDISGISASNVFSQLMNTQGR